MRSFFRIIKFAFQSILRNFWLSFVTVSVFCLTLLTVNAVVMLNVLAQASVQSVEEQVQVTVYFTSDTSQDMVNNIQGYLLGLSQVKPVSSITPEEALEAFRSFHSSDPVILSALEEVDGNPFGRAVKIRAYNAEDFPFIIEALNTPEYSPFIKDKNFNDYSDALEALSSFSEKVKLGFIGLALFFGLIAVVIVFNTIRVAIYVHRDEIGIMKLVGASDGFVRGPFFLEALMYAIAATGVVAGGIFVTLHAANPFILQFFAGVDVNLIRYYAEHAMVLFGLQLLGLSLIGLFTTFVAMRRYLRV